MITISWVCLPTAPSLLLSCSRGGRSGPSPWLCSSPSPQGDLKGIRLFAALLSCPILVHNLPSGRQGTTRKCVMKQLEPRLCKHGWTSLFWFLMVLQGHVIHSVGCARWSFTKSQPTLGCHHLAINTTRCLFPQGCAFFRLPQSPFSLCPSHGYFHSSQFCHTSNGSSHDTTPLLLLLASRCLRDPEDQAARVA